MDAADPEESSATNADEVPAQLRLSNPAPNPDLPDELIIAEILVRLPAKAVLRFRAACRAWCSGTSTSRFLDTYHDRKASLPLVAFSNSTNKHKFDDTLDTFDVLAGANHGRPILAFSSSKKLHASFEGLLLISHTNGRFNICSPATRQCGSLPELTTARFALLYSLRSADGRVEYRVLFWRGRPSKYLVHTLGSSAQPRYIDVPEGFTKVMAAGNRSFTSPSILFKEALHWISDNMLIVFNTVVESFSSMRCPITSRVDTFAKKTSPVDARLFSIDNTFGMGLLAGTTISVWVLEDYQAQVWKIKNCIELAMVDKFKLDADLQHMVLTKNGDLLISSGPFFSTILVKCDAEGNVIELFSSDSWNPRIMGLWYKENIARHSFFEKKGKRQMPQSPLFKRLREEAGARSV